ncbi:hypothetical protein AC578_6213 [Pseudocercospora eumusae]|uniref:Major facilitator superfamily (MFS) profile domain-containing protein n=1 Tax=Pseudocercospora eumusae TaxID=321146 RepID=A0A139HA00_9PEZI|nr:hypothetical protein AC578_6213 [Pseudocercospora eumusae]
MLITQPALQAMALLRGHQYDLRYLVFATFPMVFEDAYDQDVGRASLIHLSLGVGFIIGLQISGTMQDKICKGNSEQDKGSLLPLATSRARPHSVPGNQYPHECLR